MVINKGKMSNRKPNNAVARLKQDYLRLRRDPVPYIIAEPVPSNILEWHYIVTGPEATPYEGGYYHGKLVFPREFPFKPPAIYMITPTGRFKTNTRLCLSISDFHPDTWNPAWSVSTILTGLLSFMIEKSPTLGSIETSDYEKKQLALQSLEFNLQNKTFCELFPDMVTNIKNEIAKRSANKAAIKENNQGMMRQQSSDQSPFQAAITNLFVILGFAAFAFTVKYVLKSLNTE